MEDIRKISVGKNYPDGAIHYQVGKQMNLQGVPYTITNISQNILYNEVGKIAYDVFITNDFGTVLWKTIADLPIMVENNINFE